MEGVSKLVSRREINIFPEPFKEKKSFFFFERLWKYIIGDSKGRPRVAEVLAEAHRLRRIVWVLSSPPTRRAKASTQVVYKKI